MIRETNYVGSTPNFSDTDMNLQKWIEAQSWYVSNKEYVASYDSENACYDILELL